MLHHDIWLLWTFLQPQTFTIFLISTAHNLLKNPTVRGLRNYKIKFFEFQKG